MTASDPAHRRSTRLRDLSLALAAFAAANALAMLMTGPPGDAGDGPVGRLVQGAPEYASERDAERARAYTRAQRFLIYFTFNGIAAALLGFGLLARALERIRRRNLGLPEGFDEVALARRLGGSGGQPPAGSEYRPSLN